MAQIIANTLLYMAFYVMTGFAFLLPFTVCRRIDLSIAGFIALGPYLVITTAPFIGLAGGVITAIASTTVAGCLLQKLLFEKVSKREDFSQAALLISLGMLFILQNGISLVFGDDRYRIETWPIEPGQMVLGARLSKIQLLIIGVSIISVIIAWYLFEIRKVGKMLRAVAIDSDLCHAVGIDVGGIRILAASIGAGFAAVAGILIGCDTGMVPSMGFNPLLMGLTCVIVGGSRILGVACGAFVLSIARNIGIVWIASQWQDAVAFTVLLIFLIFRPQGFLGTPVRKVSL